MKEHNYAWIITILAVLTITGALGFGRFGYTMILPSMKEDLGLSDSQTGDLAAVNMIGYLGLSVFGGFLASRFGPRLIISISLIITGVSLFFTGLFPSYGAALVFRFFTGLGSGGANVPVMGLIAAWFDAKKRGLASGIAVSGSSVGILSSGLLIPAILAWRPAAGWQYSWMALGALTLIIGLVCTVFLRNSPKGSREKRRLLNWSNIYRSKPVWYLAGVYVLFGFSYIIYATFYARNLISEYSFTPKGAGSLWSLIGGLGIGSGFIWGIVSDKVGRRKALAGIYLLQAASFIIFGVRGFRAGVYISSFFFAFSAWSIPAIVAAASGDVVGPGLAPAAFGFTTLFFGVGQILGPFTAGRIAESTGSFSSAFVLSGIAALLGSLLSFTALRSLEKPKALG